MKHSVDFRMKGLNVKQKKVLTDKDVADLFGTGISIVEAKNKIIRNAVRFYLSAPLYDLSATA